VFNRLDDTGEVMGAPGECSVPLDVVETALGIEIIVDLAGVAADEVKILFVRNTLVIVGHKLPSPCEHHEAAFHLAERTFGRFARGVRLAGAFDAGRADARLQAGELRVTLPRIEERRSGEIRIRVTAD
jgi:HSP20 family protein